MPARTGAVDARKPIAEPLARRKRLEHDAPLRAAAVPVRRGRGTQMRRLCGDRRLLGRGDGDRVAPLEPAVAIELDPQPVDAGVRGRPQLEWLARDRLGGNTLIRLDEIGVAAAVRKM